MQLRDLVNVKNEHSQVMLNLRGGELTNPSMMGESPLYLEVMEDLIISPKIRENDDGSFLQYLGVPVSTLFPGEMGPSTWSYNFLQVCLGIARAESLGSSKLYIPHSLFDGVVTPSFYGALENLANEGTSSGYTLHVVPYHIKNDSKFSSLNGSDRVYDKNHALSLISGGTDSAVVAAMQKSFSKKLSLLQVMYHQAARFQEIWCVDKLNDDLGADLYRIDFPAMKHFGGSALFRDDMQLSESNLHLEYVPFRNTIFLSLALMRASQIGASSVILGAHPDDSMAPDGTQRYVDALNNVLGEFTTTTPLVEAPLLTYGGKPELISLGFKLGINFSHTWSCHTHVPEKDSGANACACGTCGNCKTRYSAFQKLGLIDPLSYNEIPSQRTSWAGEQELYDSFNDSLD